MAHPSPGGSPMAGGPGLSGSTVRLFGENTTFSAELQIQTENPGGGEAMNVPGKIYFDHGKSRFEMNMSEAKGGMMTPETAASMRSMGTMRVMRCMSRCASPDDTLPGPGRQVGPDLHSGPVGSFSGVF